MTRPAELSNGVKNKPGDATMRIHHLPPSRRATTCHVQPIDQLVFYNCTRFFYIGAYIQKYSLASCSEILQEPEREVRRR
jgi:hypothetical protein